MNVYCTYASNFNTDTGLDVVFKLFPGQESEAISGGWRGPSRHPLSVLGGGDATP